MKTSTVIIDCTLRDGGYYNDWNFPLELIKDYLTVMKRMDVDYVEIGFRSTISQEFRGACAYSTDGFLQSLPIPDGLKLGVMINAGEIIGDSKEVIRKLENLFSPADRSPVSLVRIACHIHELEDAMYAAAWLKEKGYMIGINLMQIADRSRDEIINLGKIARHHPIDVLYFADSMGSLLPEKVREIVQLLQIEWHGQLGIHTHDNMGYALANSVCAVETGASWVDCTVTGMGRGPGNAATEYMLLALASFRSKYPNITPLLALIRKHFEPMRNYYGWGTNPFYYLAGMHGIHPTYIQEMLTDNRYEEEDILTAIDYLKKEGGKKFSLTTLEAARHFYHGEPSGTWDPVEHIKGRDVLILGAGPSVKEHNLALSRFILEKRPFVIALNTIDAISNELIDIRAASHPLRLVADSEHHRKLPQPLVTPVSMLPQDVRRALEGKLLLDYGLSFAANQFIFHQYFAQLPTSLVMAYALAIASRGQGKTIYLAGFDGYGADDPRRQEGDRIFEAYKRTSGALDLVAITPTLYELPSTSVYFLAS